MNSARLVSKTSTASAIDEDSNPVARFLPQKWRPPVLLDRVLKRVYYDLLVFAGTFTFVNVGCSHNFFFSRPAERCVTVLSGFLTLLVDDYQYLGFV